MFKYRASAILSQYLQPAAGAMSSGPSQHVGADHSPGRRKHL